MLTELLRTHLSSATVAEAGCVALEKIVGRWREPEGQHERRAGNACRGVPELADLLRAHVSSAKVIEAACKALLPAMREVCLTPRKQRRNAEQAGRWGWWKQC